MSEPTVISANIARLISMNGAKDLPWTYEDGDATLQVGDHQIRLADWDGSQVHYRRYRYDGMLGKEGQKIFGREEKDVVGSYEELEDLVKPLADIRAHLAAEREKQAERLCHLPEGLRARAEEFLTLHNAWETEFEVGYDSETGAVLTWYTVWPPSVRLRCAASFSVCLHGINGAFDPTRWELSFWENSEDSTLKYRATTRGAFPLRESHDFGEFVQRFRKATP